MFHLAYPLFIGPVLESLVSLVRGGKVLFGVGGSRRVEDSNIKVSLFEQTAPKAALSNIARSVVMAEAPLRFSPVMGCRVGSMQTSLQTSKSQLPTVSQASLCRIWGKAPLGQESECSTEKCVPQSQ